MRRVKSRSVSCITNSAKYFPITKSLNYLLITAVSLFVISACGGGSDPLPLAPERPYGHIQVQLYSESLSEPKIEAYGLGAPAEREFLASASQNEDGSFDLAIKAPSQLIMLELSASSYEEPTSNVEVALAESQKLKAYVYYQSGETQQLIMSPFTHVASGLLEYYLSQNIENQAALFNALTNASELYTLPIATTKPASLLSLSDEEIDSEEEIFYGLLIAGLSQLTRQISLANESNLHETLNSWVLAQLLYADLKSDGLLDSTVLDEGNEFKQIQFGGLPINSNLMQQQFAAAILDSALYEKSKEQLDLSRLAEFIFTFSTVESSLIPGAIAEPMNKPIITTNADSEIFYAGDLTISVDVSGILKLADLKFYLDGELLNSNFNGFEGSVTIDSTLFSDGSHTLSVSAIDEFTHSGTTSAQIHFDNTSPSVQIVSKSKTKESSYRLQGSYAEGGSGIKEIIVNQQKAVIDDDGAWFVDLTLTEGRNALQITVVDMSENQRTQTHEVVLDSASPVIDTNGMHSEATFLVQNNAYLIGSLENANNLPVVLRSDKLSLNGEPVQKAILQEKRIPYFSFSVIDPIVENHATRFENLTVHIRIEKNNTILRDWFSIEAEEQQFYIPLTQELLGVGLVNAGVNDNYSIRVRAVDEAGNRESLTLAFNAAVLPPEQAVTLVDTALGENWQAVSFAGRGQLINQELAALSYEYTNDSISTLYIKPRETNINQVTQEIERVQRINKMRLKTTPYWRIGKVDNPLKTCPEFNGNWLNVTQIRNYDADGKWQPLIPESRVSDLLPLENDILPTRDDSLWQDLPHFDEAFASKEVTAENGDKLTYKFDYVVDTSISGLAQPAYLTQWQSFTSGDNKTVICDDVRNIQFMEKYQYLQEPEYPKNVSSLFTEERNFETASFEIYDEDGASITPISGWYPIPAGNKVKIEKMVRTSELPSHNDTAVAQTDQITDYQSHTLDKKITWLISQSIGVEFALDVDNTLNDKVLSIDAEFQAGYSEYSVVRD